MLTENEEVRVIDLNINQIPNVPGIYLYYDESNGKMYVGQAVDLRQRFQQHLQSKVKRKVSFDYQLHQHAETFYYRILIMGVDPSILTSLETMYIERYHAVEDGYNQVDLKDQDATIDNQQDLVKLYTDLRRRYLRLLADYNELLQNRT